MTLQFLLGVVCGNGLFLIAVGAWWWYDDRRVARMARMAREEAERARASYELGALVHPKGHPVGPWATVDELTGGTR